MSNAFSGEGAFALYGAMIGAGLAWAEASIRHSRNRKVRARFLAHRLVIAIDRYVEDCVRAIHSEPHPLDHDVDPASHAPMPNPYAEPGDVDWSSVNAELAYELLSIPGRDRDARSQVHGLAEYDSSVRSLRDELFKRLALDVDDLAVRLRREYRIPERPEGSLGTGEVLRKWAESGARSDL